MVRGNAEFESPVDGMGTDEQKLPVVDVRLVLDHLTDLVGDKYLGSVLEAVGDDDDGNVLGQGLCVHRRETFLSCEDRFANGVHEGCVADAVETDRRNSCGWLSGEVIDDTVGEAVEGDDA